MDRPRTNARSALVATSLAVLVACERRGDARTRSIAPAARAPDASAAAAAPMATDASTADATRPAAGSALLELPMDPSRPPDDASLPEWTAARCARIAARAARASVSLGAGDATGGEGTLDVNRVARVIRGRVGEIRACYERALGDDPGLAGYIEVRFTIASGGRLIDGAASRSPTVPALVACVVTSLAPLAFPPPEGGTVDFSYPFTFCPPR